MPERSPHRPATIYAVAERAGVSIASVSRVLRGGKATSPEVRAKVLQAESSADQALLVF